jgi:MFS family permease
MPFLLCMFFGSMISTMGYGPLFASLQELVPERIRSTMIAVMILSMMLLGTSLGNLLVGWLADWFGARGLYQPLTWASVVVMSPGFLAVPCFFAAARVVEQAERINRSH